MVRKYLGYLGNLVFLEHLEVQNCPEYLGHPVAPGHPVALEYLEDLVCPGYLEGLEDLGYLDLLDLEYLGYLDSLEYLVNPAR
jgi:hypothetical protein